MIGGKRPERLEQITDVNDTVLTMDSGKYSAQRERNTLVSVIKIAYWEDQTQGLGFNPPCCTDRVKGKCFMY